VSAAAAGQGRSPRRRAIEAADAPTRLWRKRSEEAAA